MGHHAFETTLRTFRISIGYNLVSFLAAHQQYRAKKRIDTHRDIHMTNTCEYTGKEQREREREREGETRERKL